jgi:hypothetical protein
MRQFKYQILYKEAGKAFGRFRFKKNLDMAF